MALPSKKRPKSEKRKRRAAKRLKKINFSICPNCGQPIKPYHLCPFCGKYKGREIIKGKISKKKK
ncbi:MAG: 50S ribosomal protein L32 [Patescibacteria group bacterium]